MQFLTLKRETISANDMAFQVQIDEYIDWLFPLKGHIELSTAVNFMFTADSSCADESNVIPYCTLNLCSRKYLALTQLADLLVIHY